MENMCSFTMKISIAPLRGDYSGALPNRVRLKKKAFLDERVDFVDEIDGKNIHRRLVH